MKCRKWSGGFKKWYTLGMMLLLVLFLLTPSFALAHHAAYNIDFPDMSLLVSAFHIGFDILKIIILVGAMVLLGVLSRKVWSRGLEGMWIALCMVVFIAALLVSRHVLEAFAILHVVGLDEALEFLLAIVVVMAAVELWRMSGERKEE